MVLASAADSFHVKELGMNLFVAPAHPRRNLCCAAMAWLVMSTPALADGAAILSCRAVIEPAQRLACYEAIIVSPARGATPTPAPRVPAPSAAPTSADSFGLEAKKAFSSLPSTIESTIPGRFMGWGPHELITLANGQVWQVSDDSRGALVSANPKVLVRRGALGAFYLEIAGTNRSPRVRRIQ